MLKIKVPRSELWDETTECFIPVKEQELQLEHSLVSISKWESKWHKPFLSKKAKTKEEDIDYVRCMTLTQNVDDSVYLALTDDNLKTIDKYINDPMTAAKFLKNNKTKNSNEQITSETIYYWMISLHIPFECQKWHLARLLTLIEFINLKNQPAKKMPMNDVMKQNAELNAQRRKAMHSKG